MRRTMLKAVLKPLLVVMCTVTGLSGCSGNGGIASTQSAPGDKKVAMQAYKLRMDGRVDEAKQLLTEVLAADPANAPAQFELARAYFYTMLDPPKPAKKDSQQTKKSPKQRGQRALKHNLGLARKAIDKAIKIDPDNARYHYWSGMIATYNSIYKMHSIWTAASGSGQARQAVNSFERAVALKPDYHEARLKLMGCYDRLPWFCGGNKSKAKQQAKKLEQLDPVYGAKARCELKPKKTHEEKLAIWSKAVAEFPENAGAHEGLSREYMAGKKMNKAVEHLEKVLELDSSRIVILLDLGWHYMGAKRLDKAAEVTQRFVDFDPAPAAVLRACGLRQLARIRQKQGKKQEAEVLLGEANKLDPTNSLSLRPREPEDIYAAP